MSKVRARRPPPIRFGSSAAVIVLSLAGGLLWQTLRAEGPTTPDAASSGSIPVISWPVPAPIDYGTPLSAYQLNARANVPGLFIYLPPPGAILSAGAHQTLAVAFMPTDTVRYRNANAIVRIDVLKVTPAITWRKPDAVLEGTILGPAQLNATASAAGSFRYDPPAGTVLSVGTTFLSTTFTPASTANYVSTTAGVRLNVAPALTIASISPSGDERLFSTSPYTITWSASGGIGGGPLSFDVSYSTDGGASFTNLPECMGVSGMLRSCKWLSPGPATTRGRIKVVARDVAGHVARSVSSEDFTVSKRASFVASGVSSVSTIRQPTIALSLPAGGWNVGKPGLIKWTHHLPVGTLMMIEITRDGGLSWASIAQVRARGTDERYSWAPSGRPTGTAKIRVSAPDYETSATSQAFAIR